MTRSASERAVATSLDLKGRFNSPDISEFVPATSMSGGQGYARGKRLAEEEGNGEMHEIQIDFRKLRAEVKFFLHALLILQSTRGDWSVTLTFPPNSSPLAKKREK